MSQEYFEMILCAHFNRTSTQPNLGLIKAKAKVAIMLQMTLTGWEKGMNVQ